MAIAHLAHGGEVAGLGRHTSRRGPDDRLGHERDHAARPDALELGLEFGGQTRHVAGTRLIGGLVAEGEAWRHVAHVRHQQRLVDAPPGRMATDRERAERVAVIALTAGDEVDALRFPAFHEVLPRHLQAGFDGL